MTHAPSFRRPLTVAVAAAAGALALAGCSSTDESESDSTTLVVQDLAFLNTQTQALADAFEEANPGVTVELQTITSDQLATNASVLSSEDPPDVGFVNVNTATFTEMLASDGLASLEDIWDEGDFAAAYGDGVSSALLGGGDTPYVVSPFGTYYNLVIYNADQFDELGIPEPENHRFTADGLAAAVAAATDADEAGIAIGGNNEYTVSNLIDPLLPTSATEEELANYLTSWNPDVDETAAFTDPAFVDVLDTISDMNENGYFQDGFLGQTPEQAQSVFTAGDSAMLIGGNDVAAALSESADFTVGWALMPPVDEDASTQLTWFMDSYGVPTGSDQGDLAADFLAFMMSDDGQQIILDSALMLPVSGTVDTTNTSTVAQELISDASENGTQYGWTSVVPSALGQGLTNPLVQKLFLGETTAEEIAEDVQDALADLRSDD